MRRPDAGLVSTVLLGAFLYSLIAVGATYGEAAAALLVMAAAAVMGVLGLAAAFALFVLEGRGGS